MKSKFLTLLHVKYYKTYHGQNEQSAPWLSISASELQRSDDRNMDSDSTEFKPDNGANQHVGSQHGEMRVSEQRPGVVTYRVLQAEFHDFQWRAFM